MNFTNSTLLPRNESEYDGLCALCPPSFEQTEEWKYIRVAIFSLVVVISIIGNILVIVTIYRNPLRLRTTVHIFIANMAVSDILGAVFVAPIRLSNALDVPFPLKGVLGAILCPLSPFITDSSFVVSVLSIVVIAGERFQAVVFPSRRALPSTRYRGPTIAAVWLISFIFYSLYFYTRKLVTEDGEVYCDTRWKPAFDPEVSRKVYFLVDITIFWAIPAVLLVGLYCTVLLNLKRQNDTFRTMASLERHRDRQLRNQNITAMLVTVIVVFYVTWTPLVVFTLLTDYSPSFRQANCCRRVSLEFAFSLLAITNAGINPFVYFILNKTYRRGMCQLMCTVCPCQKICCRKLRATLDLRDRTNTNGSVQSVRSRALSRTRTEVVMLSMSHI